MRLSYNERAVSEGRFRHHLFQAVFVRTSYPSRYVYFRWSRVHKAVETAVTATVVMWERCKSRCPREMGTPQFGDPSPHIPSDMGTPGPHITRNIGPWGPQNSGDMGIPQWFGDPRFVFYMQLEKTCKTNYFMFMQWYKYKRTTILSSKNISNQRTYIFYKTTLLLRRLL